MHPANSDVFNNIPALNDVPVDEISAISNSYKIIKTFLK